jgi:hypothetical protein
MTDIPPRPGRLLELDALVTYPKGMRYSLQWLIAPNKITRAIAPNNIDATFKKQTRNQSRWTYYCIIIMVPLLSSGGDMGRNFLRHMTTLLDRKCLNRPRWNPRKHCMTDLLRSKNAKPPKVPMKLVQMPLLGITSWTNLVGWWNRENGHNGTKMR